ncbi:uncharacterized protein MKK02DRAFT_40637 [Dioszegia hungarica]|uniref:Uncharacterized protein n=1 Tax=Dioszegia hungarica TaxID=4972 RepID=A0AA38H0U0_9TREE|nr:uncharacterized protein MKK02DRAFT_40637 [Dioszegia hungarica]KAI9632333.1 hypothetical protein MKK02DRAFT_40637 [Dioszegia hungarica]
MSSTTSSTNSTPAKGSAGASPNITPMHDPAHQAKVIPQTKPLGLANPNPIVPGQNVDPSMAAGLGQKALLAKRFAKASSKSTVSPTDQMQSPCTQKLSGAKQRHFVKSSKPASLAASFTAMRDSPAAPKSGPRTDICPSASTA